MRIALLLLLTKGLGKGRGVILLVLFFVFC
jgi:hypothetical protein